MPHADDRLLIVVHPGRLEARARTLAARGIRMLRGFEPLGDSVPPTVHVGCVRSSEDAAAAVLAALRGSGVVIGADASEDIVAQLVDDLRRLGPVEVALDGDADASGEDAHRTVGEPDETIELLVAAASGRSIPEAARLLHMSRRTAYRRIAECRAKLGVDGIHSAIERLRATDPDRVRDAEQRLESLLP